MEIFSALICLVLFILGLFLLGKWKYTYWTRSGVTQLDNVEFPFGNGKSFFNGQIAFFEIFLEAYQNLKKKNADYGGMYMIFRPVFIPIKLDLIQNILIRDFQYFAGHGIYHHERDLLTENIFNMEGSKWKELRAKLTPAFTSGKMKMMFETLVDKAGILNDVVSTYSITNEPLDLKELLSCFTTDVIGSCGFGIECDSMRSSDSEFRYYGKKVFGPRKIWPALEEIIPWRILGYLGKRAVDGDQVEKFYSDLVLNTIKFREENNIYRKDFMHMLIQLKNKGFLTDNSDISKEKKMGFNTLSEREIISQAFIFHFAGFETSATTMTFTLLKLAENQSIQDKIREEVKTVLEKHGGKLTYEGVNEMEYLDWVIKEALRMQPPFGGLPRVCTKDYKIPDSEVVIKKGTRVVIPAWGLQMDPEYYPEPQNFNPDNFRPENVAKRCSLTWLPFGDGPRQCLGLRFGMMQSKVGVATLVQNYRITINKKTPYPIKLAKNSIICQIADGLWVNVTKID